jgi:hypothetical protein
MGKQDLTPATTRLPTASVSEKRTATKIKDQLLWSKRQTLRVKVSETKISIAPL